MSGAGREVAARSLREDAKLLARLFVATGRHLARPTSRASWVLAGGVSVVTSLAWTWKRPIASFFEGDGHGLAAWLARAANLGGAGVTVTALGLALFVLGRRLRRGALVDAALVLGAAGAWCWLLMRTGQFVLAEQRPIDGGDMRWFSLDGHGVSGHAAAATLLLVPVRDVLARGLSRRARWTVTALLLAWTALVGWSRMWLGMHFLWNVVLGAALGFVVGRAGVEAWRERERRSSTS